MNGLSLAEIAEHLRGTLEGGPASLRIRRVQPLEEAEIGDISILTRPSEAALLGESDASAAIVPLDAPPVGKPTIRVRHPRLALAALLELLHPPKRLVPGVDERAFVASDARLGQDVGVGAFAYVGSGVQLGDRAQVHPGAYVGDGSRIGDDTVLFPNVSVYPGAQIGCRVRIHSGAVIGADGFGYVFEPSRGLVKIPQVGWVEIEDDVEIGANSTIDRGTLSRTRIGAGTKIDNLVQVGHNSDVGRSVCLVGQVGISGSVTIGDGAVMGGGAGVSDHLRIGARARIAAKAGVHKDVADGESVGGIPAIPLEQMMRSYPLISRLPDHSKRLAALERRCAELEAKLGIEPEES